MRAFRAVDYYQYAGAERFRGGEEPMIHHLESGLDLIADRLGVTLYGSVATVELCYGIYESQKGEKQETTAAAEEWISELGPLKKREQIALLNNLGFENLL